MQTVAVIDYGMGNLDVYKRQQLSYTGTEGPPLYPFIGPSKAGIEPGFSGLGYQGSLAYAQIEGAGGDFAPCLCVCSRFFASHCFF